MYDVIVVGAGHAGVEAATAAARRGASAALVTFSRETIGVMSCNPAIGGLGKGHIVREIDAFDGLMACAADAAAIHHRMLNQSKGSAVRGPRIQADRSLYAGAISQMLARMPGVSIVTGEVDALALRNGRVDGVVTSDGTVIRGRSVVLATGTFLGARLFRGTDRDEGGRIDERPARALAQQLRAEALPMARLKTGTPPRLDGRTIDWAVLDEQRSDAGDWTMSPLTCRRLRPQVSCAITRTTGRTHDIIRAAFDRSPLFSGAIEAPGPRYCPSIEDKVDRFGDRDGHQIFLEPEGLSSHLVYPNGISTSLPVDIQQAMIASIPGLARARITVPGYAVEYDHIDPRALDRRLALDAMPGLFCAGQINGTTGYEEAAGQGLIAGLNAAAFALDLDPVILDRASSYIGVMIDDLVLQGVSEPYRMLTARAEFRLSLRADNAETRLAPIAEAAGCLSMERQRHQVERRRALDSLRIALDHTLTATEIAARGVTVAQDGARRSAYDWLRQPGIMIDHVAPGVRDGIEPDVVAEIVEDARYAPYLARQAVEIARLRQDEGITLPSDIDYTAIPGLSAEMVGKLAMARPGSLAAAARLRGITPAALSAIHLHIHCKAA